MTNTHFLTVSLNLHIIPPLSLLWCTVLSFPNTQFLITIGIDVNEGSGYESDPGWNEIRSVEFDDRSDFVWDEDLKDYVDRNEIPAEIKCKLHKLLALKDDANKSLGSGYSEPTYAEDLKDRLDAIFERQCFQWQHKETISDAQSWNTKSTWKVWVKVVEC